MMNDASDHDLYWTGGPFQVTMLYPSDSSPENAKIAIEAIEVFRDACQKQYIAFHRIINGRNLAYNQFNGLIKSRNKRFGVGTCPPEIHENSQLQKPGHSCIAALSTGELLDGLAEGGTFEAEHAKACVIMIFALWEDSYRSKIADIMRVEKNNVMCELMNDVRHVRNCIIHEQGIVSEDFQDKLVLLSQVWKITPGELKITEDMLNSLMEQINALRVEIQPRK